MKIFILDTVKPQLNNAGAVHRWELIRNLAKIGHDVWVIAYKDIEIKRVHTTLLKAKEGVIGKLSSRFRYVGLLFKLAMRHHFDILYTRNGLTGVIGYLLKIITGSKLVYELNGILSDEWETIRKENRANLFKRVEMAMLIRIEMFALKKADAIIAVTEGIKNYLTNHGISKGKITVIGNGVNIDMFKPINNFVILHRLRKQYNINEDDHVIGFVGNLAPWQGIEYLIKSAPLIIEKFQKMKFLIVGDGIMRKELENMVKELKLDDKFIFTGIVPYELVPKFISISDVCVCPSPINSYFQTSGGSSLKIFEYLACGKPVVTGDIKGDSDLVVNSNSGFAVRSEDREELAEAIIKLLKNEKLRLWMGENGREAVVKNHSWKRTAEKVVEVYEKIIQRKEENGY